MAEHRVAIYPNGVKLIKWPHKQAPTADTVASAMVEFGYKVYDLQTVPAEQHIVVDGQLFGHGSGA